MSCEISTPRWGEREQGGNAKRGLPIAERGLSSGDIWLYASRSHSRWRNL